MDIQAVKPVSSGSTQAGPARIVVVDAKAGGKELPPVPQPVHMDQQVAQTLSQKRAAVAQQVSEYLRSNSRDLQFQLDAKTGDPVIVVLDAGGNVVRRIPGDDALQMLRQANVDLGTFIDSMA